MLRESYAFSTLCRPPPSPVPSRAHCAPAAARTKHRPAERAPALPYGVPCPSSIRPFPHPPPPSLFPSCFPHYLTSSSYFLSPSATPRSSFCFLLLMVTSLALPSLPLLFLQLAPDGSAVNFPSWLNCLERMLFGTLRLVATTQATATGAPDNAAARDLARILAESLESTRKHLTAHLAAPNPRCASTPLSSAPSHSDLLADLHVANACACQVIPACLPPTLLAQCSHIRSAKDLLGYLTERYQSQTPIGVIALLRELTSLRLADFTTMADYIARVQTLCPSTVPPVTPSSTPPPLSTTTVATASSHPRNTFPPCTYIIRQGPRKGHPCSCTNHPTSSCFQKLTDEWFLAGNTIRPPNWLQLSRQHRQSSAQVVLAAADSGAGAQTSALRVTMQTAALSLPRTLEFVLDSGATDSVFRDAGVLRSFPRPLSIQGAGDTMTMTCTATSSLPCRAAPSDAVTDLYVPSCRHNLLSLSALQRLCAKLS
ncbi:unnamed protein product [Closterium sp. NIES-64]|nr:unnamed protein product [Closterium sp. NIES-64]